MNKGFTLVELAIVIVIIGLLVGGVLQGQILIRQAEINKSISEIESYRSALTIFQGNYKFLPGDIPNATNLWGTASGGCPTGTRTAPQTCNGDGDGKLLGPTSTESGLAWQHLANAKLIKGSYLGFPFAADNYIPSAAMKNGRYAFWALSYNNGANINKPSGTAVLMLGARIISNLEPAYPIMSAEEAFNIDSKIDDGDPYTGSVFYWFYSGHPQLNTECVASNAYVISSSGNKCAMAFVLTK